ncbi:MAG: hypothetical protein AAGC60_27190 [Acidobacteriota bacterium]
MSSPPPPPARRLVALGAVGAAVAAFVHAGLYLLARRPEIRQLAGDEITYLEAARRLLVGDPAPPELLWPPLYPRLLAALEAWAARRRPADIWHMAEVELVQMALLGVAAVCAGRFAWHLGVGARGALGVAVGVVAFPPLAAFAHYLWPEVVHLALFFAALVALAEAGRSPDWPTPTKILRRGVLCLLAGVLLGLALLTKSLLTGFVPVLLLAVWLEGFYAGGSLEDADSEASSAVRRGLRAAVAPLVVAVALGATVAPTLVANHRATGLWTIADSSSFNLWVGLQDDTRRNHLDDRAWDSLEAYRAVSPDPRVRRDFARSEVAALLEREGWVAVAWRQLSTQYFRLFHRESYLTDQLPSGLLADAGAGYLTAPGPLATAVRLACWGLYALLLVAAAWGLAGQRLRVHPTTDPRVVWRWVLVAFLVYNLLLFFGLHVKTRYRVPLLPVLMIWAAQALEVSPWHAWAARHDPATRRRLGLGAGFAAVALVLAFGAGW